MSIDGRLCVGLYTIEKVLYGQQFTWDYQSTEAFASGCMCGSIDCVSLDPNSQHQKTKEVFQQSWMQVLIGACLFPEDNISILEEPNSLTESGLKENCFGTKSPEWLKIFCALCLEKMNDDDKPIRMTLLQEFVDRFLHCRPPGFCEHSPITVCEMSSALRSYCKVLRSSDSCIKDWMCLEQRGKCFIVETACLDRGTHFFINIKKHRWFKNSFRFLKFFVLDSIVWPFEIHKIRRIKKEIREKKFSDMTPNSMSFLAPVFSEDAELLLHFGLQLNGATMPVPHVLAIGEHNADGPVFGVEGCIDKLHSEIVQLKHYLDMYRKQIRMIEIEMVKKLDQFMPYIEFLMSSSSPKSRSFSVAASPEVINAISLLLPDAHVAQYLSSHSTNVGVNFCQIIY